MKKIIILFLIVGLGLTASCDYASYKKGKDAEKGKVENSTKESSEESAPMENSSTENAPMENSSTENKSMDASK